MHATPVPMLSWVWQERRALREQQRAVEAAEEARRKLVTVTLTCLGARWGLPVWLHICTPRPAAHVAQSLIPRGCNDRVGSLPQRSVASF